MMFHQLWCPFWSSESQCVGHRCAMAYRYSQYDEEHASGVRTVQEWRCALTSGVANAQAVDVTEVRFEPSEGQGN